MDFGRGVRLIAVGLFLALLLYIAYVLRTALLLIFVSIVFAIIFNPIVQWIERWHIRRWSPGRGAAILIFVGLVLTGIAVFVTFAGAPIARDSEELTRDLPQNVESVQRRLRSLPFGNAIANRVNENEMRQWIQAGAQRAFGLLRGVMSGVMALFTLALLTAYFMLDGGRAFRWAMSLVPVHVRDRLSATLQRGARRMQRWLYGQLTLMLILGSATALVFGLLGVRYFYALAVFAGIANFVPVLGPIATVVLAAAVAALDSWTKVLGVFIFYFIYQQVENAYLTPRIMKEAVDLPGIAVIVALTIGGEMAGLLGAIVAVPTAALVATILNEYVVRQPPRSDFQSQRAA